MGVRILAIETSCDETAAAVVEDGRRILSNVIYSQIDLHTEYGGVVPEIASRSHIQKIDPVIRRAMSDAGCVWADLDAIAVTYGPGLVGPLLVGVAEAKALSYALGLPLVAVNHIAGHIAANALDVSTLPGYNGPIGPGMPEAPYIGLVVSGGHTHLVIVEDHTTYRILGRTVDDAAGEVFDKVARAVGLGYPGGPKIDRAAADGNPDAMQFPKAVVHEEQYSFSFSGLKSAVLNYLNQATMAGDKIHIPDLAASFQKAVVDVLCTHLLDACKEYGLRTAALSGGVSSNSALRKEAAARCAEEGITLFVPPPILCTDNAAMIGAAAYPLFLAGTFADETLNADPRCALSESGIGRTA